MVGTVFKNEIEDISLTVQRASDSGQFAKLHPVTDNIFDKVFAITLAVTRDVRGSHCIAAKQESLFLQEEWDYLHTLAHKVSILPRFVHRRAHCHMTSRDCMRVGRNADCFTVSSFSSGSDAI